MARALLPGGERGKWGAKCWGWHATHTIKVVVVGTAGRPRVDVDAFVRQYIG